MFAACLVTKTWHGALYPLLVITMSFCHYQGEERMCWGLWGTWGNLFCLNHCKLRLTWHMSMWSGLERLRLLMFTNLDNINLLNEKRKQHEVSNLQFHSLELSIYPKLDALDVNCSFIFARRSIPTLHPLLSSRLRAPEPPSTPDHLRLENINLSKLAPNSSLSKLDTFVGETPAYILNTIAYCQVLSVRHHFLHVLNVPWPRSDKKKWQLCVTRNNNNRELVFVKRVWHDGWLGRGGGRHHSLPASKIWSYLRKQRNSVTLITKKCI